jgi:hypothetical protein
MLGIVLAWIKFLEKELRAKAVKVDGKYVGSERRARPVASLTSG